MDSPCDGSELKMRWHKDYPIIYREWKKHHRQHVKQNIESHWGKEPGYDPWDVSCSCDEQIGRFRKKDAWDCGKSHCFICHSDKFPKRQLSFQEIKVKLRLMEEIQELFYAEIPTIKVGDYANFRIAAKNVKGFKNMNEIFFWNVWKE